MTDNIQSFPLILSIRDDGSAKKTVDGIALQIDQLFKRRVSAGSDPLGIKAMVAGLNVAPLQKAITDQANAENALAQQRARYTEQRIADSRRELDAALSVIRARQAAQTAAFEQAEAQGNALIALDKQRIADSAALVAAPAQAPSSLYFNPVGAQAAAAAARAQATALAEVAAAAHLVANAEEGATVADRAFAVTVREAAVAAGLEAERLEELVLTLNRVSGAMGGAGGKFSAAGKQIEDSVRAQRFATIQASQQFQDFFIQIQGGQNPLTAFSQQASQLAFVMSGAGGTAGKFAAFMGGPWGTAIFAGISVLAILTSGLFDNKKAHEEAEKAAKAFGDRQADIKNFIDSTTGSLIEQNKTLVLNAILTRKAALAANDKEISDSRRKAFDAAGKAAFRTAAAVPGSTTSGVSFADDSQVQAAIRNAGGNVDVLASSLAELAKSRPELKGVALEVSNIGGQAILATRDNRKLNEELAALTGNKNISFKDPSAVSGLVAIAAATDKYSKSIATLNEKKRELDASVKAGTFTGSRDDYIAQAAAIERQIAAQKDAKGGSSRGSARSSGNGEAGMRALAKYGETTAESIKRINAEFDDQPRLIDRASIASGRLDDIIKDLAERKPPGFKDLIEEAEKAKDVVANGLTKPYRDLIQSQEEQLAIGRLIVAGRIDEADALRDIVQLERVEGPIDAAKKQAILANIEALHQQGLAIDAINAKHRIELDYLGETKSALLSASQSLFKGDIQGLIATPGKLLEAYQNMQGQKLFENLFGQSFRDLEAEINGTSGLKGAAEKFAGEVDKVSTQTDLTTTALDKLAQAASGAASAVAGRAATTDPLTGDILVSASPEKTIEVGAKTLNKIDENQKATLGKAINTDLLRNLQPILAAASVGSQIGKIIGGANGGSIGGGIGGLLQLAGNAAGAGSDLANITSALGSGLQGYTIGTALGSPIADLISGKGKKKDGQQSGGLVGGTAGFLVGGPIGAAIGSFLGNIFGSIFSTTKRGGALVTSGSGSPQIFGNDAQTQAAAGSLAGSVQAGLKQISSALGVTLGSFAVSIGYFGDKLRVDTSGYTGSLDSKHAPALNATPFASEEEAVRYAIVDAIKDGAIKGIHQGAIRLLEAGGDLDQALQKALSFEQVFKDLKQRTDPLGYALDTINDKFDTLRQTFAEAGASSAELAQLEQLYGLERADAVKQAQQQLSGALQDLLDSLTYKADTGLSLRTREAAASAAFNPLAATVAAGGKVDQDAFVAAAQAELDLVRQIYGSTQPYFDKLAEVTALTAKAIVNAGGTVTTTAAQVSAAAAASVAPSLLPAGSNVVPIPTQAMAQAMELQIGTLNQVVAELQTQTATLTAQLTAVNRNLGTLIENDLADNDRGVLPIKALGF